MTSWGFLGAGWVATKALAPAVHKARNARLRAVASQDAARAQALVPEKIYRSYEELLADPKIDAVYINLANHQHHQWTIAALDAGKHVLCEKPLALNYAQAQEMADATVKNDRILVEALWNQWHPRFTRIVELVTGGHIGALTEINSSFTFTAELENSFRGQLAMGGGSLLDVGNYQAHIWKTLSSGEPELEIQSLNRSAGNTGVDLTTQISATLSSGVKINALSSFEMPEAQELIISGKLVEIQCLGSDAFTSWNKPSSLRIGNSVEEFAPVDPYAMMIEDFSDAISGKPAWLPALDQSLYVAKLLDQIKAAPRN
ncbi:MviM Predicted dehydrogenases and related proteins [Candidatus Nanopelagicaceae bacterium]